VPHKDKLSPNAAMHRSFLSLDRLLSPPPLQEDAPEAADSQPLEPSLAQGRRGSVIHLKDHGPPSLVKGRRGSVMHYATETRRGSVAGTGDSLSQSLSYPSTRRVSFSGVYRVTSAT